MNIDDRFLSREGLPPQTLQLMSYKIPTVVQSTIEKALYLSIKVNLEWCIMASDTNLYNVKLYFSLGSIPPDPLV